MVGSTVVEGLDRLAQCSRKWRESSRTDARVESNIPAYACRPASSIKMNHSLESVCRLHEAVSRLCVKQISFTASQYSLLCKIVLHVCLCKAGVRGQVSRNWQQSRADSVVVECISRVRGSLGGGGVFVGFQG